MRIRAARAGDIPGMHRVRTAVRENRLSAPDRVTQASYLPYVRRGTVWVAEEAGRIAGFAALDASAGSVWALFVDPAAEGSGIGTALHRHMLEWAAHSGIKRLCLATAPGTRAEAFYAAAGWTKDGLTETGEVRFRKVIAAA